MEDMDYPRMFEVVDATTGIFITYEDPSPTSGTILMQKRREEGDADLLDEQLIAKTEAISLDSIIESWEARVEDHQGERPPFDENYIKSDPDELELAQEIHAMATRLDALVSKLESHLDEHYSIDISEARYELRKAAEFAMCAADRTKEIANG